MHLLSNSGGQAMYLCMLIVIILIIPVVVTTLGDHQVYITQENELEYVLCNAGELDGYHAVILSTNITHLITGQSSFCLINSTYSMSLTITATEDTPTTPAVIYCTTSDNATVEPRTGFAFINLHNLTLNRLVVTNCGGYLKQLKSVAMTNIINSTHSPIYFTTNQSSVLLFFNISSLLLHELSITDYYGFATVAINPINALINNVNITYSQALKYYTKYHIAIGSGILLLFMDITTNNTSMILHTAMLNHINLVDNIHQHNTTKCLSNMKQFITSKQRLAIINAAGLTIIYAQHNFTANVHLNQSIFLKNYGSLAGAMLIIHYNSISRSHTAISESYFNKTFSSLLCGTSSLSLLLYFESDHKHDQLLSLQPLSVVHSWFANHSFDSVLLGIESIGATVLAYNPRNIQFDILFKDVEFLENSGTHKGTCLYATTFSSISTNKGLNIILEDIYAHGKYNKPLYHLVSDNAVFSFAQINKVIINGSHGNYTYNFGSLFEVADTDIILEGNLNFELNYGDIGTVFKLYGTSTIYLHSGLTANFSLNNAQQKGGVIYGEHTGYNGCLFQPIDSRMGLDSNLNITMLFLRNIAVFQVGNDIFSDNLYNCQI